jgi:serine protease Do
MRVCFRDWARVLVLLLAACFTGLDASRARAVDVATPAPHSDKEKLAEGLRQLFDGGAPRGVADLRAMQSHVQRITDQLTRCTVGVQVGNAWGSGVIISKDGYVLTAAHVAGRPNLERDVEFRLSDGRKVKGKTLGLFRTMDAGLMKIVEPGEYPFAEMGNSNRLKDGQWCLAMGHPGGYQEDRGAVLRFGRITLLGNDAITTDCTLVGGDSGGPLFDMEGHVIGINSRIAGPLTANMHVPVSAFQESWDRLTKGEAWGHLPGHEPYLGVTGKRDAQGAEIESVKSNSPAERGGLKSGDVVLKFDGRELSEFKDLVEAVAECQPNESVKVQLRRGEEVLDLRFRLGKKE